MIVAVRLECTIDEANRKCAGSMKGGIEGSILNTPVVIKKPSLKDGKLTSFVRVIGRGPTEEESPVCNVIRSSIVVIHKDFSLSLESKCKKFNI